MKQQQKDPTMDLIRQRVPFASEYYDQLRYESDPLGGYRLCRNQKLEHVTINNAGYRGAPFTGKETILLLGDSVTFGIGASRDSARFSQYLSQVSGQGVADASVRAYRVFQHYAQLPALLERLPKTRHLLLWMGYADLLYWVTTGGCVEGAFAFEQKYAQAKAAEISPKLIRLLKAGRAIGLNLVHEPPQIPERCRETGDLQSLALQINRYTRAIRDLCGNRGITVEVMLQPFIRTKPQDPELAALMSFYEEKTAKKCGISWTDACKQFLDHLLPELSRAPAVVTLDLQPSVREGDFLDQVHLKESACAALAQTLKEGKTLSCFQPIQKEELTSWNAR